MSRGDLGILLLKPFGKDPGWQPAPRVTAGPSIPRAGRCAAGQRFQESPGASCGSSPGSLPTPWQPCCPELFGASIFQGGEKGSWRWHPQEADMLEATNSCRKSFMCLGSVRVLSNLGAPRFLWETG